MSGKTEVVPDHSFGLWAVSIVRQDLPYLSGPQVALTINKRYHDHIEIAVADEQSRRDAERCVWTWHDDGFCYTTECGDMIAPWVHTDRPCWCGKRIEVMETK